MSRDALQRLYDIETACQRIIRNTEGQSRDEVFADELRFDGLLMNLHIIGEAVKTLPDELRERHAQIPWRRIAGMRDFISHAYFAVDLDIVWDTITRDVPELLDQIQSVLDTERPGSGSR